MLQLAYKIRHMTCAWTSRLASYRRVDLTSQFLNAFSVNLSLFIWIRVLAGFVEFCFLYETVEYGHQWVQNAWTCLWHVYLIGGNIPSLVLLDTSKLSHIWCIEWLLLMERVLEMSTCLQPCWCLRTPLLLPNILAPRYSYTTNMF